MTTRMNNVVSIISNRGYNVDGTEVIKNGVTYHGITVRNDTNIAPTVYLERIPGDLSDEETADKVLEIAKEHASITNFDISKCLEPDYIYSNAKVRLQRKSDEPLVKMPCGLEQNGIEAYISIDVHDNVFGDGSIKLKEQMMPQLDLDMDKLFFKAKQNVEEETEIRTIASLLGFPEELMSDYPMWVVSTRGMVHGASAILSPDIQRFKESHGFKKMWVLPSSVHEVIIVPDMDGLNLEWMKEMVQEINGREVAPDDQLADAPFAI